MFKVIDYFGKSEKGQRLVNQDYFLIKNNSKDFLLLIVADGMGGHRGGKIASRLAVQFMYEYFEDFDFDKYTDDQLEKKFYSSIKFIHKKLLDVAKVRDELMDMGTTLNFNIFVKDILYTVNVGDSRSTIIEGNKINFISEDQNLSTFAKKNSEYSYFANSSNQLLSSLGPKKKSMIDIYKTKLKRNGYIIITTDGVHNHINAKELISILSNEKLKTFDKCKRILRLSLKNETLDNITCILVKYEI